MRLSNYDKYPHVPVTGHDGACVQGWDEITAALQEAVQGSQKKVVAVETYTEVIHESLLPRLGQVFQPDLVIKTLEDLFIDESTVHHITEPWMGGDDPIFGFFTRLEMQDFLDPRQLENMRKTIAAIRGTVLIYGPGASLCGDADLLIYADMPRWEAQNRQRRGEVDNLGLHNRDEKASLQYKRSYFVDWRVCDKLKQTTMERWDYLLDTTIPDDPKLVTGEALRAGLAEAAQQPFRVVPFFDPGPWGGQWMKEVCGLDKSSANFAWCFDCVPEENSLCLRFGETVVEIPSINLVFRHPKELLGEGVYGRFGAEFPIRFDFLDTIDGGNLSFQVHPLVDFAREHFGLPYTQDESYYILDAQPDGTVYLGLREDVEPEQMLQDLATAQSDPSKPFQAERHAAEWPAKKHDHFLIPAGTVHCSGAGSMVLEISHTPYIFTFKLWDWGRLGLDGLPRPINLERGAANIQWDRREAWVKENLVNAVETVGEGDGWREERTGLYRSELIETRRTWFTGIVPHDTRGGVNVINLVEGEAAVVESPTGAFKPFEVHYAETFIIPAAVGSYTIRPLEENPDTPLATLKAYIREFA